MSKNAVIFCSGLDGKVKLLSGHERQPWVLYYLEHSHSIVVVDFATRPFDAEISQSIMRPHLFCIVTRSSMSRTANDMWWTFCFGCLVGPNGAARRQRALPSRRVLSNWRVRHLSLQMIAFSESTRFSHSEALLIQTTNYLIFYDFLAPPTLFLSNLGASCFEKIFGLRRGWLGSSSSFTNSCKSVTTQE